MTEFAVWKTVCHDWVTNFAIYMSKMMIWKDEAAVGAEKLAALGQPVRWAMLRELARADGRAQGAEKGTVPVSEMAARLGMKRPAVANHLPQMLAAGVLAVYPDAGGDGRKRCLGLPLSATVRRTEDGLEVDFGDVVVRFPQVPEESGAAGT